LEALGVVPFFGNASLAADGRLVRC